ncbi:hypothetical protein MY4038_003272 [Beauveria bassiana]
MPICKCDKSHPLARVPKSHLAREMGLPNHSNTKSPAKIRVRRSQYDAAPPTCAAPVAWA